MLPSSIRDRVSSYHTMEEVEVGLGLVLDVNDTDTSVVSGVSKSNSEEFNVDEDKENEISPPPSDIL